MSPTSPEPFPVLLSTSSVFPEPTSVGFELAAGLGFDGVEVMVWTDAVSQNSQALSGLAQHYGVPVLAVHAPCLATTQRVWSSDPWERLRRAAGLAESLAAPTVVVHPPFAWQGDYAATFVDGLAELAERYPGVRFAVENMYPVRILGKVSFVPYRPNWDPTRFDCAAFTLDVSHCAAARRDCLEMADSMGERLAHIHLGDGVGKGFDEHLVPGRGKQPCAELLGSLRDRGFSGAITLEVSTKGSPDRATRVSDLRDALQFTRLHLGDGRLGVRTSSGSSP